jgi:hypothetical protein
MSKFYVQSGSIRGIVDCYDSECAAVWAVNRVMEKMASSTPSKATGRANLDASELSGKAVDDFDEDEDADLDGDIGMFALDDCIRISEIGFDRDDCECVDTHLAFVHWHQLKKAIDTIQQQWDDL